MADTLQDFELIKQITAELLYIDPANGYTNKFKEVNPDWKALGDQNNFDECRVWAKDDLPRDYGNSNIPNTSELEVMIDVHTKCLEKSFSLTEKIASWKRDMRRWIYGGSSLTTITANKWLTIGESANDSVTGAMYKGFTCTAVRVSQTEDMALIQFQLKVKYNLIY